MIDMGAAFELARPMASFGMIVLSTLIYCNFAEYLTTEYENIANAIYQLAWYRMTIETQKKIPTMIEVAQRSVRLRGYATLHCSLEFFRNVSNFGFYAVKRKRPLFTSNYSPFSDNEYGPFLLFTASFIASIKCCSRARR